MQIPAAALLEIKLILIYSSLFVPLHIHGAGRAPKVTLL
jgi:hypothetical protein